MSPKQKRCLQERLQERQEVAAQEQDCSRKLRRVEQELRSRSRAEQTGFTACQRHVALTIFVLDDWKVGPAVDFLLTLQPDHPDLEYLLKEWALEEPLDVLLQMEKACTAPRPSAFKRASSFLVKWRLEQWVAVRNVECGLAPPTAEVLRQHDVLAADVGGVRVGCARGDSSQARNRMWGTRWRRAHAVVLREPRVVDAVPVDDMRSKARAFSPHLSRRCPQGGCVQGTNSGPEFWAQNWDRSPPNSSAPRPHRHSSLDDPPIVP